MGVEFHITRADFWADNDKTLISSDEWLAYVATDAELKLLPGRGPNYTLWLGASAYEEPWMDWSSGNIQTKWPDTALYLKMLQIAAVFGANVQDDNGTVYKLPEDWQYDPNVPVTYPEAKKAWWRFW